MERKQAEELQFKNPSSVVSDAKTLDIIGEFIDGYRRFIDTAKTERLATAYAEREALSYGFRPIADGEALHPGDKVYYVNKNKCIILAVVGKKSMENGCRIIASHIDSPRLDFKPQPMFEQSGISYFKTHYYGGIKKYQWTAIPLELHGVVYLADGSRVDVNIGADDDDPVFYISDLMPHIGKEV